MRPDASEDARLVERARVGDRAAFEALVRRHLQEAHSVARRHTRDPHDAEDVCQDAFLTALERIEDCGRPERFRGWLMTIVKNTALNAIDRRRRRRAEPLDEARGSPAPARGDDLERRELRDRLREAVAALPEMQRKVLLMHDYEGWTHREIGTELGIAAGTCRYHLHTARRGMREHLEARGHGRGGAQG